MFHSHISCNLSSKVTLKSMWSQARWRKWFYCWRRIISWQIMIMMADADLIETCQYHWLLTIIIDTTISLALQLSSHNTNQARKEKIKHKWKQSFLTNSFNFQTLSKCFNTCLRILTHLAFLYFSASTVNTLIKNPKY